MEHLAVGAERTVGNEAKVMSCLCLGVSRSQGIQCGCQVTPDCCYYKQPQPGRGCVLGDCVTGPERRLHLKGSLQPVLH